MLDCLAEDTSALAKKAMARVLQTVRTLEMFPEAAAHDAESDTFDRQVPKTAIALTYAIRDAETVIITAWHTFRDPGAEPERKGRSHSFATGPQ